MQDFAVLRERATNDEGLHNKDARGRSCADDLHGWAADGRWSSWSSSWGTSSWGASDSTWAHRPWTSPGSWEGRWKAAGWWGAGQPAAMSYDNCEENCSTWSLAKAEKRSTPGQWWSTAAGDTWSDARWADGDDAVNDGRVCEASAQGAAMIAEEQVQEQVRPEEHHPVEVAERGVRLTLEHNGQEAPAWMLNGPEYKIIDMDGGTELNSTSQTGSAKQRMRAPVHHVVADLETIAASAAKSSGRSAKDVTLDVKTKRCCIGLVDVLGERPEVDRTLLSLLVRASIALAKIKILHQSVLDCLGRADPSRLRALDAARIVDALWAFATLGILQHPATAHWAAALGFGAMRQLSTLQLANLSWAAAVLEAERLNPDLPKAIAEYVQSLDVQSVAWSHLARIAWGLTRMMLSPRHGQAWAVHLRGALEAGKPRTGPMLGEAFWALAHWHELDTMRKVAARLPDESWGRDAYGVMLRITRNDCRSSARTLQQMSEHLTVPGLKAAVLNSVLLRLVRGSHVQEAELLLREMARQGLWTPVTYHIHHCLGADCAECTAGRPPAPGRVDPGQSAHKYTKAVYEALEHAEPGDAKATMVHLENYSREKGWLKFGAEGEKGSVIDSVVQELRPDAVVVELGTFLGYSAIRIARQLGPRCRIITVEFDAEVACLAENVLLHADMENNVEVWIGSTEDIVPELRATLGGHPADLVYMDHNQQIFHEDVQRLEAAGVIAAGTAVVATQVLKPGAPLLAWHLAEQQRLGRCTLELVSSPDCGCSMMEDWVAIARYREDPAARRIKPGLPPAALQQLARLCNLMRWRTAQGLVDEKKWNCFVQHVRAGMEAAGLMSTRHVWQPRLLSKARQFRYIPFDF